MALSSAAAAVRTPRVPFGFLTSLYLSRFPIQTDDRIIPAVLAQRVYGDKHFAIFGHTVRAVGALHFASRSPVIIILLL